MNKISFIIEFDEVSKTQEEQLAEFIEKTGIKFHVLESDNDLKKYKKYKQVIDKAIEYINKMFETGFYNDDIPCELIINKMEKMIKELKEAQNEKN